MKDAIAKSRTSNQSMNCRFVVKANDDFDCLGRFDSFVFRNLSRFADTCSFMKDDELYFFAAWETLIPEGIVFPTTLFETALKRFEQDHVLVCIEMVSGLFTQPKVGQVGTLNATDFFTINPRAMLIYDELI